MKACPGNCPILPNSLGERLIEELAELDVQINTKNARQEDLTGDESFGFLVILLISGKNPYKKMRRRKQISQPKAIIASPLPLRRVLKRIAH